MRDQPEWRLDCRPRAQQAGRDLGYTRYDKVAGARLYAEHVAEREAIRPAPAARLTEFAEQLRWRVLAVDGQKPGKVSIEVEHHLRCDDGCTGTLGKFGTIACSSCRTLLASEISAITNSLQRRGRVQTGNAGALQDIAVSSGFNQRFVQGRCPGREVRRRLQI